jgi:hypothetical protein
MIGLPSSSAEPRTSRGSRVLPEVGLGIEFEAFTAFDPTALSPATVKRPIFVAAGVGNREATSPNNHLYETSEWLAPRLGSELVEVPGAHVRYLSEPEAFVDAIRPPLRTRRGDWGAPAVRPSVCPRT